MSENKISAPIAEKIEKKLTIHNDERIDNYYWLNQKENPKKTEQNPKTSKNPKLSSDVSKLPPTTLVTTTLLIQSLSIRISSISSCGV